MLEISMAQKQLNFYQVIYEFTDNFVGDSNQNQNQNRK